MAVQPSDFRAFADLLDRTTEIGHRNAVSRLYYSFYLELTQLIPSAGGYTDTGVHQGFIEELRNPAVTDVNQTLKRRIALALESAKAYRTTADYKIDRELDKMAFTIMVNSIDKLMPEVRKIYS